MRQRRPKPRPKRAIPIAAISFVAFLAGLYGGSASAQTFNNPILIPDDEASKTKPARSTQPQLNTPGSTDFTRSLTADLDATYDGYLAWKKSISDQYHFDFSLDFSVFPQFGTSGKPVDMVSYYPSASWRPFTDTSFGSGEIDITVGHQVYFSRFDNGAQSARMGLITFANDWVSDNFSWSTLAYTHTLPGDMNWLSITGGQYNLFTFDPNTYAGNAQTTFIGYGFAQDATQTFPNSGLGAYLRAKAPNGQFSVAGGFEGGTDLNGGTLTTRGFETGEFVTWGNLQWTPTLAGLGPGIYSLLIYDQPSVPEVSSHSLGISLSLSQAITDRWGVFFRANNATGPDIPIRTSIAAGGVRNDPFSRNPSDQLGFALGWDKTNADAVASLPMGTRPGEWFSELYYRYTVFKGLQITPDVQLFRNPALNRDSGAEAVFTIRTTAFF